MFRGQMGNGKVDRLGEGGWRVVVLYFWVRKRRGEVNGSEERGLNSMSWMGDVKEGSCAWR